MAKPVLYRQCRLSRILLPLPGEKEGRTLFDTSWVPTAFAKKGKAVTIDGIEGTWVVVETYEGTRTAEELAALRGDQREMADVLEGGR